MKAKKKLLIGTLAAALVASGAGAVSTMAWYTASTTGALTASATQGISTVNGAELSGVALTATWKGTGDAGAIVPVTLTAGAVRDADASSVAQAVGTTYVYNGSKVVAADNQSDLIKVERIVLTLSGSGMDAFVGNTYTVKIAAGGQLRANTSLASGTFTNGKNAWVGANVAVASDYLTVGTITITSATTLTYDSVLDINGSGEGNEDQGLYFYVSVTADNLTGADSKSAGDSYGTLSVQSIA